MPRPSCRISTMFGINCRSRLASTLPLSLRCFDEVDFVCFDSHLVDFTVFDSCRFGFVFDGLSSSSTSGPFADLDSVGTIFSSAVCRSASVVRWDGPSTTSLSISKETLFPTIFYWFREMMESSLKITSLLWINFRFSGSQ